VLRALPLRTGGAATGGLILLRDVTELRSRERELMTKEATIREIHHRVKNNLQTVAALLRLQARRTEDGEGRQALEEAVRRVGTIAVVHDTLSQAFDERVDFDEVADRLRTMVVDVSSSGSQVTTARKGSFGPAAGRDGDPVGHGADRDDAERRGARLRRFHRPPRGGGPPDTKSAAGDGRRRRGRAAGRLRPVGVAQPRESRS
jgi:hypothetical protein